MLARHELDEVGQILLAAAALMEEQGHTKFTRRDSGGYCALGAIGAVSVQETYRYGDPAWADLNGHPAVKRLANHLGGPTTIGEDQYYEPPVARWNNADDRTAEEVITKFREVAYDPQYALVTA